MGDDSWGLEHLDEEACFCDMCGVPFRQGEGFLVVDGYGVYDATVDEMKEGVVQLFHKKCFEGELRN